MQFKGRLKNTVFEHRWDLFLAVTVCMLGLFAFATVHEILPGLCTADEEDGACPFCILVFTLALAVCLALYLPECGQCRCHASQLLCTSRLALIRYTGWLRAPPVTLPA